MIDREHKEIIDDSHRRSAEFGLDPDFAGDGVILDFGKFQKILQQNTDLSDLALPVLQDLYRFVQNSGFILILTDAQGCILHILGDAAPLKEAAEQQMVVGAYMNEKSIGTNAMGTALAEDVAVQVCGQEHFLHCFQRWTCSAAPIHDEENSIIGTLNLTGKSNLVHPHTLGLVAAAVSSIESTIRNREVNRQLNEAHQYAYTLMNNLSYGVFAIDLQDDIQWANDTACRILQTRRTVFLNKDVSTFIPHWEKMRNSVLNEEAYLDEQEVFSIPGIKETFLFNVVPIATDQMEMLGFIITFRSFSRMAKLIGKFTSTQVHYSFDDIVAESEVMSDLIAYAKKVSVSNSTVLISGDSGTGKEVFAQSIHNASLHRERPFVAVNCGAIPESLIESELFGYEEGAFTGSRKGGRTGRFEQAADGTLFLDEIGEMPLNMQVKLLRTLQEGTITRVGGDKPIPVKVRIIAATNKNLEEEVKQGRFRLDLFYRLNVIQIVIPPLRDRRDDIIPLARMILKNKSELMQKAVPVLDKNFIKRLVTYDWPGNVRELNNLMEKFIVFDGKIDFKGGIKKHTNPIAPVPVKEKEPVSLSLKEIEKQAVINAVSNAKGNISLAAKVLGISRNTLYQKLSKYGISLP